MHVLMLALILAATPLVDAVKTRDIQAVRALLDQQADVNGAEGDGATPLHWAAYLDSPEIVELLIARGAKANTANDLAITPLHLAAVNGNAAIVNALLAHGADPNAASETGVTPLMEAARTGNVDVVRALLDRGADINAQERDRQQTALMWAVSRRHPQVVTLLLERQADVRRRTGVRSLTVMLDQGPARTVKTAKQDARSVDAGGSTALLFAAQNGDAESAALLLAAGADANDRAADGRSALVLAAFAGHPEVARVLIDAGADVNAADAGYSALHAAALRGDRATVAALLAKGADPNAPLSKGSPVRRFGSQWALPTNFAGGSPLFVAAAYLEVEIMRALLAAGATPDIPIRDGTTALLTAAGVAVQKEARPSDLARWNVVDNDTPQVPRDEQDVVAAVSLLLDAGADVRQANEAGSTALHGAAGNGLARVIQLLVERGADVNAKNKAGQTPLALTMPRGRPGAAPPPSSPEMKAAEELLRKLGATP